MQPEPVTDTPPRSVERILLQQSWRDVAFLHWTVDRAVAATLLPAGVQPDLFGGRAFVGLVALRMRSSLPVARLRLPWLGTFGQAGVRIYSVDHEGRRGMVLLRVDASRLMAVLTGRTGLQLPYTWSRTQVMGDGDRRIYLVQSHSDPVREQLALRVGRRHHPNALERFLVDRWGIHARLRGRTVYVPLEHAPWPLQQAEPIEVSSTLPAAAGVATLSGPPISVLYSPGVDDVRIGSPLP